MRRNTIFGREIVGNLTTVTNSVRGFTTLLLGLYFAEEVREIERIYVNREIQQQPRTIKVDTVVARLGGRLSGS